VENLKVITREASTRVALYAFEYAVRHNRKRVTAIHKANIMVWLEHESTMYICVYDTVLTYVTVCFVRN